MFYILKSAYLYHSREFFFFNNYFFSKKLLNEKIFKTLFLIKKKLYSFSSPDAPFPSKKTVAPETVFRHFFRKYRFFLEKTDK